jgi:transposase
MRRHESSDEQSTTIEPLVASKSGDSGRSARHNRLSVNTEFWIAQTGAPRQDLPERLGTWNTVYKRFGRSCTRGVWGRVLETLTVVM